LYLQVDQSADLQPICLITSVRNQARQTAVTNNEIVLYIWIVNIVVATFLLTYFVYYTSIYGVSGAMPVEEILNSGGPHHRR